ncbi:TetR/AcrR family transcriptional regulator [Acinetobacter rongchengensis]|uniref:TetR/AcrR family transcriptional regulator n=1 Tax=Acinetobacter rongchengensis TaxID=2419601 RepID=A0A3A8ERE2_9GAMM|nr:TetR/AcrR family transcriptional regulator [Acinetobacter rongchengensis]RKG37125.1 TetR/AcrR family transcriptional regulator [Acinetobacter rongchengensis]
MQTTVGRPKDLEKRKHILEAAKKLFLKLGYHGSSMNQIAKEAGVTKLTVYNHFQDKETLFCCAIEATCEKTINASLIRLNANSDFQAHFYQVCELALYIINLPEAIKLEHLLLELAAEQNPLAMQFYNVSHQRMCNVWQDFFEQATQLKFIQANEIEKQINLILSLLLGIRHHEVLLGIQQPPTPEEKHQIISESIELFMMKYKAQPHY